MAKIKFTGLDSYMAKMTALEASTDHLVGAAIYAGADVVANDVKSALLALPTSTYTDDKGRKKSWFGTPGHLAKGPSLEQKEGLIKSFGITPMKVGNQNFINVHIGFDGYNSIVSKRWPKGQPNQLVARAVNSGTSFMESTPFVKRGVAKARRPAKKAMEEAMSREVEKIMKG